MEWQDGVRLPVKNPGRSWLEIAFVVIFVPGIIAFYSIYKWPAFLGDHEGSFYLLGKSPGFYYGLVYTGIVCGVCLWVLKKAEKCLEK